MAEKNKKAQMVKSNEKKAGNVLSALQLLEADHAEVKGYFEQYEQLDDAAEKEELALKICMALRVHAQLEEEIFYPAAREAIENTELIDEALVEHNSAKQLIAEIEEMDAEEALYDEKVKVLGEQVSHHVEEEEGELFPEVESSELDQEVLGKKMADRKVVLLEQEKTPG